MIESLDDPCVLGFFWVHDWILDHPYVLGFVCAWFNVKLSILLIWVLFWVRRELGTKKCFALRLWKSLTQKFILFHNQPHCTFSSSPIKDPRESIPKLKFSPAWMVAAGFHHVMVEDDEDDGTKVECCCCCLNTKWWCRWWKMRLVVDDQDSYY